MTMDVRGSGTTWAVFYGPTQLGGHHNSYNSAMTSAGHHQRRIKLRVRACMTCQTDFKSEGAHNRMCDPCRGQTEAMI